MDIGILTYHNNENKGAILQGLCLYNKLRDLNTDWNVEVVNYYTISKEISRFLPLFVTRKPTEVPTRIRDWIKCKKFTQREFELSEEYIFTDNYDRAAKKLDALDYDLLVVGSDEIWRVHEPNSGITIRPNRPFPNLYIPGPEISSLKVSYAASANALKVEELTDDQKTIFQKHLEDFDLISVRDEHTKQVLDNFGIEDAYRVSDPTLIQEIPNKDVSNTLENNGVDVNSPIIGVHGLHDSDFGPIFDWYRDKGYQVISPMISPHADINLKSRLDPFEYYSLYSHFDLMVTSSLHSTIFSVKQRTPFITIDTSPVYKCTESKTKSLLRDLNLLHRHYDAVNGEPEELIEALQRCETPLDKRTVSQSITEIQEQSDKYLQKVKEYNGRGT